MKLMKANRLVFVLVLSVCLVAGLSALAQEKAKGGKGGGKPSGTNYFATLDIVDIASGLYSDGKGIYEDWRLEGDPCVKAWVKKDGFFFIYFYRGNDQGATCEEDSELPDVLKRRYRLFIPDQIPIPDAFREAAALGNLDVERIRAEDVFSRKATETPISFGFHYDSDNDGVLEHYNLDTEGDIAGSGDTRTVSNTDRTAQLWISPPQGSHPKERKQPVGPPFFFPFQLTVTRVAQ